jgi:hypothetical protein
MKSACILLVLCLITGCGAPSVAPPPAQVENPAMSPEEPIDNGGYDPR